MEKPKRPLLVSLMAPVALILLGYNWFYHFPLQRELQGQQQKLMRAEESRAKVNRQFAQVAGQLADERKAQDELEEEVDQLNAELAALRDRQSQARREIGGGDHPASVMDRLQAMLQTHSLAVVDNQLASSTRDSLPKSLAEVPKLLGSQSAEGGDWQQFRIKAIGRFSDLRGALRELAASKIQAVPLSIQMESGSLESDARVWILTLLI